MLKLSRGKTSPTNTMNKEAEFPFHVSGNIPEAALPTMTYKEAVSIIRGKLLSGVYTRQRAKAWYAAASQARAKNKIIPGFEPARYTEAVRQTILCAALTHSRGKMHFKRVGHEWAYDPVAGAKMQTKYDVPTGVAGLEWQAKTINEWLKHVSCLLKLYPDYRGLLSVRELQAVNLLVNTPRPAYQRTWPKSARQIVKELGLNVKKG